MLNTKRAITFFKELLESVETLSGVADQHGYMVIVHLMYLQNTILTDGRIDLDLEIPAEATAIKLVRDLPSSDIWTKYIRVITY